MQPRKMHLLGTLLVMWVAGGEWGIDAPGMQEAAEGLYNDIKALDATRPVFQAWAARYYSSGNIVEQIGSDLLSYHDYRGWYWDSAYSFYGSYGSEAYPVIITECIGAYTDICDGGFQVSAALCCGFSHVVAIAPQNSPAKALVSSQVGD